MTAAARGGLLWLLLVALPPPPAAAQLSTPCEVACAAVLGATSVTAATGTLVAVARHTGGVSSLEEGLALWGLGFAAVAGGGLALGANGDRQERAVYAAGIGALAGSLVGLLVQSTTESSTGAEDLAAVLVGATAGVLAGGVFGALSHEGGHAMAPATISVLRIPL